MLSLILRLSPNYTQCVVEPEPESEGGVYEGLVHCRSGGAALFIGAEKAASINALVPAQWLCLDNGAVQEMSTTERGAGTDAT